MGEEGIEMASLAAALDRAQDACDMLDDSFFFHAQPRFLRQQSDPWGRTARRAGTPGPTAYRLREGLVVGCPLRSRVVCDLVTLPALGYRVALHSRCDTAQDRYGI